MRKSIANIITLLNLFVGCVVIIWVLDGEFLLAFWGIVLCGIADILDGFVARKLGTFSDLGLQLDSMADLVSFGVVPGTILFQLLEYTLDAQHWLSYAGFIFTIFAALRLAHFNILEDSSGDFVGLPTPSATGFVTGLILIHELHPDFSANAILNPVVILSIIVILSALMISKITMVSLKFKGRGWSGNEWRYLLIIVGTLLLILLQEWSFSLIIIIYIISSIVKHLFKKNEVLSKD